MYFLLQKLNELTLLHPISLRKNTYVSFNKNSMKEKKNNGNNQIASIEKNQFSRFNQKLLLEDFARKTVMENYPETKATDQDNINSLFIEHHTNLSNDIEIVEKILEAIVKKVNTDPRISKLLKLIASKQEGNPETTQNSPTVQNDNFNDETINIIVEFIDKNKLKGDDFVRFQNTIINLAQTFSTKKTTKEVLETALKISNLDNNLENKFKNGILEGRNQRIEEHMSQYSNQDGLYSSSARNTSNATSDKSGYIERLLKGRK